MKIRVIFYFLLYTIAINGCGDPGAATAFASNTFGFALNGIMDKANQLIEHAQNSGLILEVNGGAQVQTLVAQAKDAYKDDLDKTISSLDAKQQKVISDIDGVLKKAQGGLSVTTSEILTITNTLPLADHFPQVRSYSGTIISPNLSASVIVKLDGNFFDAPNEGYDAVLKIGDTTIKNIGKTTAELEFPVPQKLFSKTPEKIEYNPFSIEVDYKKRSLLVFTKKQVATFNFFFVVLPERFGSVVFELTQLVDTTLWQDAVCPNLDWNTHNNQDDDQTRGCTMEDGWICDVASVHPQLVHEENRKDHDWFDRGSASSPTFAGWHFLATTRHGAFGNYGGVTVNLLYKKYKKTQILSTTKGKDTPLQWGDSKVFNIPPSASWKLTFKQFDGAIKEIASSEQQSPYIKVETAGSQITVKLAPFGFLN